MEHLKITIPEQFAFINKQFNSEDLSNFVLTPKNSQHLVMNSILNSHRLFHCLLYKSLMNSIFLLAS